MFSPFCGSAFVMMSSCTAASQELQRGVQCVRVILRVREGHSIVILVSLQHSRTLHSSHRTSYSIVSIAYHDLNRYQPFAIMVEVLHTYFGDPVSRKTWTSLIAYTRAGRAIMAPASSSIDPRVTFTRVTVSPLHQTIRIFMTTCCAAAVVRTYFFFCRTHTFGNCCCASMHWVSSPEAHSPLSFPATGRLLR